MVDKFPKQRDDERRRIRTAGADDCDVIAAPAVQEMLQLDNGLAADPPVSCG